MLYNKQDEAYVILGHLNVAGRDMARIKMMKDQTVIVVTYREAVTGDFYALKDEVAQQVIEKIIVNSKTVEATTPRNKVLTFKVEETEEFCKQHNLDLESVKACIDGEQKTHRKWGFVLVD